MPAARAQAFAVVTQVGADVAVACHGCGGCCACQPPRRGASLQPVGDPASQVTTGKTCDCVRRQLR
jgi:hypothetical protein